jgi:hypothetical protein
MVAHSGSTAAGASAATARYASIVRSTSSGVAIAGVAINPNCRPTSAQYRLVVRLGSLHPASVAADVAAIVIPMTIAPAMARRGA